MRADGMEKSLVEGEVAKIKVWSGWLSRGNEHATLENKTKVGSRLREAASSTLFILIEPQRALEIVSSRGTTMFSSPFNRR